MEEFIGKTNLDNEPVFIYCRVTTKKQEESGNLNRQACEVCNYMKEFARSHDVDIETIEQKENFEANEKMVIITVI